MKIWGKDEILFKFNHHFLKRRRWIGLVPNLDILSSELGARQAQREVVKIKNSDFSYWA